MKELKKFRVNNDLSQQDLADYFGVTKQHISNVENGHAPLSKKMLRSLLVNQMGWDTAALEPIAEEFRGTKKREVVLQSEEPTATVPVFPMDAMAGPIAEYINEGVVAAQCERILSPIAGATCAVRIFGDSMYPKYSSGSVALLREINENIYIEWGRTYVLDTENGPIIKMVNKGSENGTISCSSFNSLYQPFELKKDDILHWYRVLMVMSFE